MNRKELTSLKKPNNRPHVVILGAGASRAACPPGDLRWQAAPLMNDVVEAAKLHDIAEQAGYDGRVNLEELYRAIWLRDPTCPLLRQLEERLYTYFSGLVLPPDSTIYDILILSLRPKDAIFTFNWDPFLIDRALTYANRIPIPKIFHLHGNVRLAYCKDCDQPIIEPQSCPLCGRPTTRTPLLFPAPGKDYDGDPFIRSQWDQARDYLRGAFLLTIFGYGAPTTDEQAVSILKNAWKAEPNGRWIDYVELINTECPDKLDEQWSPFAFYNHLEKHRSINGSFLANYPRRTCEAIGHAGSTGDPVETTPLPTTRDELFQLARRLADFEK